MLGKTDSEKGKNDDDYQQDFESDDDAEESRRKQEAEENKQQLRIQTLPMELAANSYIRPPVAAGNAQ